MEWKNNAPYVLCLSHDVDRVKKQWYHYCFYGLKHPIVQLKSLWNKIKGIEPYWNFEKLMELEEKYGVRSTFFFLNESHKEHTANFMGRYDIESEKVANIIRVLDKRGYEIGLHGSYYSYCDEELMKHEKEVLECIVGHRIVSTRQHHLNLEKEITWKIQKRVGLLYDSSVGYSDSVCDELPSRTEEGIIEIPITFMDTVEINDTVIEKCCEIAKKNEIIMLNFHQCHYNEMEYPNNVTLYTKLLKMASEDGAWIINVGELGKWLGDKI